MPVEVASMYLLDAANEVDMQLSLEVAVSGRTDTMSGKRTRNCHAMMEEVGLAGLAATLTSLGEGERAMVPFDKNVKISFQVKPAQAGSPSHNRQSPPTRPVRNAEPIDSHA